jgi:CxxC motif-containing protein
MGCALNVEINGAELTVTGNRCPRGAAYAREEITAPKRTLTATCRLLGESSVVRRVPVRTSVPCPREKINDLLADIYRSGVSLPVKSGDKVIADWQGTGIDVIAVRSVS